MPTPRGKRILVVDDEPAMREYVQEVLHGAGHDCLSVQGGMRALSCLAEQEDIDLVLSDINMPGLSGMELLRTVKAVTPELPFILVSGLYELGTAIDALKSGATDYLYKPVRPDALLSMVERHLQPGSQNEQRAFQQALGKYLEKNAGTHLSTDQVLEVFNVLGFNRVETMEHSRPRRSLLPGTWRHPGSRPGPTRRFAPWGAAARHWQDCGPSQRSEQARTLERRGIRRHKSSTRPSVGNCSRRFPNSKTHRRPF